jgi:hypothetical protein
VNVAGARDWCYPRARHAVVRARRRSNDNDVGLGLAIALAVVSTDSERAYAQSQPTVAPPVARLEVQRGEGAESCRDLAGLEREVQSRLGRPGVSPEATRAIDVQIVRDRGRWRAVITLREPGATEPPARRVLESSEAQCAAAVALAVTLAIDPSAPMEPVALVTPPTVIRTQPVVAVTAPTTPVPPSPPPIDEWNRGELFALSSGISVGSVPVSAHVAVGFEGARRGLFRPWVTASRTIESRTMDPSGAVSFGFSRTSVAVGACAGVANARFSIDGCASALVGAVTAVVHDTRSLEPVRPGDYPWIALGLSARGSVRLWGPLALELGATPFVSLLRQRFSIEGRAVPAFEQLVVGADVWAGVRARFW